jgi:hypothetical protein
MTDTTSPQPPVDRVRLGTIQAAIWENTDAEGRTRYSVTVERRYRDADGNWKSTGSFGRDECLTLAKVVDLANSRIHEMSRRRTEQSDSDEQPGAAE